jgi:hypothetical protein
MKTFSALIALALAAFATASTPAFAMSSGYWSAGTNNFTQCRPALVPQTGSEKRRSVEELREQSF